jgi:hypothetical protein
MLSSIIFSNETYLLTEIHKRLKDHTDEILPSLVFTEHQLKGLRPIFMSLCHTGYCTFGSQHGWSLTNAGKSFCNTLENARKRHCKRSNLTKAYIDRRIRETGGLNGKFMRTLRNVLAQHLSISARAGLVEDHIQNWLVYIIQNDTFRPYLEVNRKIYDSKLIHFALRRAYIDCRAMAMEPVTRELTGARTTVERSKGLKYRPSDKQVAFYDVFDNDDSDSPGAMDFVGDTEQKLSSDLEVGLLWKNIVGILKTQYPDDYETRTQIIRLKGDECSFSEISRNLSVPIREVKETITYLCSRLDPNQYT